MRANATRLLVVLLVVAGSVGAVAGPAGAQFQATTGQDESCEFPFSGTDATATEVTVDGDPDRVVVLAASTAQTMWEIDAESEVVGMPVNRFTAYLNGSEEVTNVVNQDGTANAEKVIAQDPDVVLAGNINYNDTIETIRDAGITVYKFEAATTLEDVVEKTRLIGRLTGNCGAAEEVAAETTERVDAVERAVEGEDRPLAFYPLSGGFAPGEGTFIHDLIRTAGARNLAAEAGITGYKPISDEEIASRDPEWIVVTYVGERPEDPASLLPDNSVLRNTTAAQEGQIVAVNANYLSQAAPRVVRPLGEMAAAFHPDAYPATETPAGTTSPATNGTPTTESDDGAGGMPGFGPGVAAASVLVAAVLLARRR